MKQLVSDAASALAKLTSDEELAEALSLALAVRYPGLSEYRSEIEAAATRALPKIRGAGHSVLNWPRRILR